MAKARIPENEEERLRALSGYDLLDREVDSVFDTIIQIAADICDVDISVIALIDRDRQFFLARNGMKPRETPRAIAFCAHAILEPFATFEIPDATKDPRFRDNPLVTGEIGVRFYAAQPLTTLDGHALGGLCLIGKKPKALNELQRDTLRSLGKIIMKLFESRKSGIEAADRLIEAKEAAEAANDAKSVFLSTVNHEIRTPLTSLLGSLGLLLGGVFNLSDKARSFVEIAHRNGTQLLRLITDLLDIQKMDAGQMDFDMQLHDLDVLVRKAVEANQSYAEKFDTTIVVRDCPEKVQVVVDAGRFAQVMANLISNACKYSPPKSPIEISAALRDHRVYIAVADHGPGIPEEFRDKIFEEFTQAESSDNKQQPGTGLGLAIAKKIVEKHEGAIDFENGPKAGTIFKFDLPVH